MSSHSKHAVPVQLSPHVECGDAEPVQPQNSPVFHQWPKQEEIIVQITERPPSSLLPPKEYEKTGKEQQSWRAAIIMVSSLFLGSALAVTHNIMNYSLKGKTVASVGLSQQWVSHFGTALAFLIQIFFALCVRVAFVQTQWLSISTLQRAIRVKDFDVLSSALMNPFSLFTSSVWLKYPHLFTIAMISWIIPLAAVITSGTLSVESRPLEDTLQLRVPQLTSDYHPYSGDVGTSGSGSISGSGQSIAWFVVDESQQLSKLAFAAATSSQIIPMKPDFPNQTYPLMSFFGPALKCADANETMVSLASNFANDNFVNFLAWAGDSPPWTQIAASNSTLDKYRFNFLDDFNMQPNQTKENTLWIASALGNVTSPQYLFNVTRCQMWNASYEIQLTYQNFEQTSVIQSLTYLNTVLTSAFETVNYYTTPSPSLDQTIPYRAVMSAIDSLIVGVLPRSGTQKSNRALLDIDFTRSEQIKSGLEDFSHNLTLSLFSVPAFLANNTDTIPTKVATWSNIYIYHERDLLLAYSLTFLVSVICCMVGLYAVHQNGGSFRNNFSTHIRAAEGSDLNIQALLPFEDTGADPLPRSIGDKVMRLGPRHNGS